MAFPGPWVERGPGNAILGGLKYVSFDPSQLQLTKDINYRITNLYPCLLTVNPLRIQAADFKLPRFSCQSGLD